MVYKDDCGLVRGILTIRTGMAAKSASPPLIKKTTLDCPMAAREEKMKPKTVTNVNISRILIYARQFQLTGKDSRQHFYHCNTA